MESHASQSPRQHGLRFGVLVTLIVLVVAAGAPAESQIAELEPGPYSYQHAQLMADAQARSFGQRRPPCPAPSAMRAEELENLCRHLDSLQEQLRQTEQKLAELSMATAPAPQWTPEMPMPPARQHDVDAGIAELSQHREMLAERADQRTMELRELREHVMNREREIASELSDIHEQLLSIERELVGLDRQRQEDLERLMNAQNRAAELEERLRRLMAEVDELRRHVADRIGANHRREEAIRIEIEQTRQKAQRVRDQLEEIGRVPERAPTPMPGRWPMYVPPAPCPAPVPPAPCPTQVVSVPCPDPALQTELKLLREEVSLLREQLRQPPTRVEVLHVENPYAVGSARYYCWPCR
jgi:hypothetical protein